MNPSTLLWIGPTRHPEVAEAFEFCFQNAAQIAVRRSPGEASRRPAGHVQRVLIARVTRQAYRHSNVQRLSELYSDADFLVLTGQLCDGESRSGSFTSSLTAAASNRFLPPDLASLATRGTRLRFSRWPELLPQWLAPCGVGPCGVGQVAAHQPPIRQAILVVADRWETAEPLCLWGQSIGHAMTWHRRYVPALHRGVDWVLWDDSAAPATTVDGWQQRLQTTLAGSAAIPRHAWLAHQPSHDQISAARQGGVQLVCTKPICLQTLLARLSRGTEFIPLWPRT